MEIFNIWVWGWVVGFFCGSLFQLYRINKIVKTEIEKHVSKLNKNRKTLKTGDKE